MLKDYFIPYEGNNNRPHILRPRAIAFVVMVALVAEWGFVFSTKYILPQSKLFGIIEVNALVDETNQNRVTNGLPDLQMNPLLEAAARAKANDEASKGYFAHTSPQGLTPWYWFQQVGYNFDYAGENLAVNFSDSQDVTDAWMNSPEHRANILSNDFTQIGIATAQGIYNGQPATFVVEEFGAPAPVAASTPFVNIASAAMVPTVATSPASPIVKKPAKTIVVKPATIHKVPPVPASPSTPAKTVSAPSTTTLTTAAAPSIETTAANTPLAAQSNLIQQIFSDPKAIANDFYFFVMALFLLALILNIFINIRVQYPKLIAGGLLVVVVVGLCIMLNQNIGFLHTIIL